MSNKCVAVCHKSKNSVSRSRSMPPNSQQEQNGYAISDGYNQPPPRRSGHNCNGRRKKSSHSDSRRLHMDSCAGYAGDSQQQSPYGPACPPGENIAALTAQAYNSYKQTYKTQELSGYFNVKNETNNDRNELDPVPGNSPSQGYDNNVYQQSTYQQQFNNYEACNNNCQQQAVSVQNDNPVKVVVRLNQNGNSPPASGKVVWSSTNQSGQQYSQTQNIDSWSEEEQFLMGGNADNHNYNQLSESQKQVCLLQKQNEASFQGKQSSCLTSPIELALQVQPKPRFRAGGGGGCCGKKDMQPKKACQDQQQPGCCQSKSPSQSLPPQQTSFAVNAANCSEQLQPANFSAGVCNNALAGVSEPEPVFEDFQQAFGGSQVADFSSSGLQPRKPSHLQSTDAEPMRAGSSLKPQISFAVDEEALRQKAKREKQLARFEFTSPDTLRTKLQQYVLNRPIGNPPVGKIKPFRGPREDAISCIHCYSSECEKENAIPAGCQSCIRTEMTAEDFLNEELAAKKIFDDAKELEEKEKTMAEVACYKSIMPLDFTCKEQIQYMKCLGASGKAICAFKEMQQQEVTGSEGDIQQCACGSGKPETSGVFQSETSGVFQPETSGVFQPETFRVSQPRTSGANQLREENLPQTSSGTAGSVSNSTKQEFLQQLQSIQNTPLPDPNYRKKVLARQVMPPSQRRRLSSKTGSGLPITPIVEESEHCQPANAGSSPGNPNELAELLQQCRNALASATTGMKESADFMQSQENCTCDDMQKIVDEDVQEYQKLQAKSLSMSGQQPRKLSFGLPGNNPTAGELNQGVCEEATAGTAGRIEEEDDEEETAEMRAALLVQYPQFGPLKVTAERSLKETQELYREHLANIRRRYFGEVVKYIDDVENITPDIAAAMVFSEEEGVSLKAAPQRIYDYLYPEQPSQPLVTIGDVTKNLPEGYDDIVVPLIPPLFLTASEFPALEDPAMLDSPRVIQVGPSLNLADEPMITNTKGATDIAELVTGMTDSQGVEMEEDEDGELVEAEDVFNVKLPVSMPPHYSRMQMRGSQAPNWFPGYYIALQSKPGVKVNSTHGSVLEQIWEDVQPDAVRPGAGASIIGN